ncbi:MAG TPA: hypothetical protein VFK30_08430, partial [Anaerolineae bacterium]|nr:hypothetical protein [Anaerolineae bacterium]
PFWAGHYLQLITADKTVIALAGSVPVKVSRENGSSAMGDPLSSASTPAESFNFFILISVIVLIGFVSMVLKQRSQTGGA